MNPYDGHYAQMDSELTDLSSRNAALLDQTGLLEVRELIAAREYGLAYEVLAAAFVRHPSQVENGELTKLHSLAEAMHIDFSV